MARNDATSAMVDGILKAVVTGGVIASALALPNLMVALEKPLNIFYKKLDDRAREREIRRVVGYMKRQQLLTQTYEHGLIITKKGRQRLDQIVFEDIKAEIPAVWDKKWRMIFYDIPEKHRAARQALTSKLRQIGCYQLQRSVWVYPFACRQEIEIISSKYHVARYTSLVEAPYIDSQEKLIERFQIRYPSTSFK